MSNFYKVYVFTNKDHILKFQAPSLIDAYDVAADRIIDMFGDNLGDVNCGKLSNSDLKTWNDVCDDIYNDCDVDISDIEEYETNCE